MTREIKLILLMAVITVTALALHHGRRRKQGLSLTAYGRELLGIQEEKAGRKQYMDLLRFLAVVLVIVVHSMGPAWASLVEYENGLVAEGRLPGGEQAVLLRLLQIVTRSADSLALVCNLLFVMISGALLLPYREERPGEFYVKRFSRVLIPLAAYYLFYLITYKYVFFNPSSLWNGLKIIISGPNDAVPHFWLAYLLLGLYIAVPFQRWMMKDLPDFIVEGMAVVVFAGSVFRVGLYVMGCPLPFSSILFSWEGIFFFGYFLTLPCSRKYDGPLLVGGAVSALIIGYLFCRDENAAAYASNYSPLMILFASAVFVWFRNKEEKGGRKLSGIFRILVQMGNKYSFSILLIHWFILFVVLEGHLKISAMMFGAYGVLLAVLVQILATLLAGFFFSLYFDQTVVFLAQQIWDKLAFFVLSTGKGVSVSPGQSAEPKEKGRSEGM